MIKPLLVALVVLGSTPAFAGQCDVVKPETIAKALESDYDAWKKTKKAKVGDTVACALEVKSTDAYSLDRVGELVAAAKGEKLAKSFVAFRVKNLGSADENISTGLARVYEAMPEAVLQATAAVKDKKHRNEVTGSVAFGLMNVHYKKKSVAQIKNDLKAAHPKVYKKPYPHHALANEVLEGIVEE